MACLKWWALNSVFLFFFGCQGTEKKSKTDNQNFEKLQADLGEKLFFFQGFSKDKKQSCGSCHKPDSAFASAKNVVSEGIERNPQSLLNVGKSPVFFWEGRERNLESLVLKPILNQDEMHGDLMASISEMNRNQTWKSDFEKVYGTDTVYSALISRALAGFVRRLSKEIDFRQLRNHPGMAIFQSHCSRCHVGKIGTDFSLRKSILAGSGPDSGHFRITRNTKDAYFFKTPGLAGLSKTAPYAHDGRFSNLEKVVLEYSKKLNIKSLENEKNKKALIDFLNQL